MTHAISKNLINKFQSSTTTVAVTQVVGSLRYRNADALKNAVVEEGLGRGYGVRGEKI